MNPLAWLLAPVLAFLLGVPLGSALIIATVATPAAGSLNANPCATVGADGTLDVS